jgi:hypothetical protein
VFRRAAIGDRDNRAARSIHGEPPRQRRRALAR